MKVFGIENARHYLVEEALGSFSLIKKLFIDEGVDHGRLFFVPNVVGVVRTFSP